MPLSGGVLVATQIPWQRPAVRRDFLVSLPTASGTSEPLYTFRTRDVNEHICLPSTAVCRRDCTMEADTLEVQTSACLLAPSR